LAFGVVHGHAIPPFEGLLVRAGAGRLALARTGERSVQATAAAAICRSRRRYSAQAAGSATAYAGRANHTSCHPVGAKSGAAQATMTAAALLMKCSSTGTHSDRVAR